MRRLLPRHVAGMLEWGFDRQHLVEILMTISIVGMTFVLIALTLVRFTGAPHTAARAPEPETEIVEAPAELTHREVELGRFEMTTHSPMNNSAAASRDDVRVLRFKAAVLVPDGNENRLVENTFSRYQGRVRAAVDAATRHASEEELQEPALESLRGRIRTDVNRLLGRDAIHEVVVSEFSLFRL